MIKNIDEILILATQNNKNSFFFVVVDCLRRGNNKQKQKIEIKIQGKYPQEINKGASNAIKAYISDL